MRALEASCETLSTNTEKRAREILILATKSNTHLRTVSTESLPLSHTDRNI